MGMLYAAQSMRAGRLEAIKELEAVSGAWAGPGIFDKKNLNHLGEKEPALSWLEQGLATGAIGPFYKDEPVWDPIRGDSRLEALSTENVYAHQSVWQHAINTLVPQQAWLPVTVQRN